VHQVLKPDVFAVGARDWDRRLFDELIPLPDGTSYNAYLIRGTEKTALIDTVDPTKSAQLIANLQALGVETIDYIVTQHAEQDHSGSVGEILRLYPNAKIVTNQKCKNLLCDHLLLRDDQFLTIVDGETLALGNKTLQFIFTPWVHWPETMCTYLQEEGILFSCDFFGSHLAQSELYVADQAKVYESAKRYYAEIMMPFRTNIQTNLAKVQAVHPAIIAPSHGPVYPEPQFILEAYAEWTADKVKNEVLIPYVSMHGSTELMVNYLVDALVRLGITVKPFNLPRTDIGELAMALVDAATVVIGTPTVILGPHPYAVYGTYLTNLLRPKTRFATVIGSYGWGGKTIESIQNLLTNLKAEILPPVMVKGQPRPADYRALDELAALIQSKHQSLNLK